MHTLSNIQSYCVPILVKYFMKFVFFLLFFKENEDPYLNILPGILSRPFLKIFQGFIWQFTSENPSLIALNIPPVISHRIILEKSCMKCLMNFPCKILQKYFQSTLQQFLERFIFKSIDTFFQKFLHGFI